MTGSQTTWNGNEKEDWFPNNMEWEQEGRLVPKPHGMGTGRKTGSQTTWNGNEKEVWFPNNMERERRLVPKLPHGMGTGRMTGSQTTWNGNEKEDWFPNYRMEWEWEGWLVPKPHGTGMGLVPKPHGPPP